MGRNNVIIGVKVNNAGAKKSMSELTHSVSGMGKNFSATGDQADNVSESFGKLTQGVGGLSGAMAALTNPATLAVLAIGSVATAFVLIGKAVKTSTDAFIPFEKAIDTLDAFVAPTGQGLQDMTKEILKLGATTEFTATQVTLAYTDMGKAGLNTTEIIKASGQVLNFASAQAISMAESSGILTTTMNQFNISASESGRIFDAFSISAKSAKLEVGEISEAMKMAGVTASSAGVSLEETTALITLLAKSGIKGTMAGTGLSRVFLEMSKDGSKVNKALAEFAPNAETVEEKLLALRDANMSLSDASKLFGLEHAKTGLALVKNIDQMDELTQAYKDQQGLTDDMADTMRDNLQGATDGLSSATDGLKLAFAGAFAGSQQEMIERVTTSVQSLTGWVIDNQENFEKVGRTVERVFNFSITLIDKVGKEVGGLIDIMKPLIVQLDTFIRKVTEGLTSLFRWKDVVDGTAEAFENINSHIYTTTEALSLLVDTSAINTIEDYDKAIIDLDGSIRVLERDIAKADISELTRQMEVLEEGRIAAQRAGGRGASETVKKIDEEISALQRKIDLQNTDESLSHTQAMITKLTELTAVRKQLQATDTTTIGAQTDTGSPSLLTLDGDEADTGAKPFDKMVFDAKDAFNQIKEMVTGFNVEMQTVTQEGGVIGTLFSFDKSRIAQINSVLDAQVALRKARLLETKDEALRLLDEQFNNESLSVEQRLELQQDYETRKLEIQRAYNSQAADLDLERTEIYKESLQEQQEATEQMWDFVSQKMNQVAQVGANISQIASNKAKKKDTEERKKEDQKLKDFKGNAKQRQVLQDQIDADREARAVEIAKAEKRRAILQATVDYATGLIKIWSQAGVNVPLGAISSGALTALYGTQLGVINTQQFANGGVVQNTQGAGVDKEHAMLTPDEIVLNKRQTANVFKMIDAGEEGGRVPVIVNIESLTADEDGLQALEDKLDSLQSSGRFNFR